MLEMRKKISFGIDDHLCKSQILAIDAHSQGPKTYDMRQVAS